jgi:hypothetical protein
MLHRGSNHFFVIEKKNSKEVGKENKIDECYMKNF